MNQKNSQHSIVPLVHSKVMISEHKKVVFLLIDGFTGFVQKKVAAIVCVVYSEYLANVRESAFRRGGYFGVSRV